MSVNADKTTMVLFTNNRKIGGFYNLRLFGTELRMTDQVKYLRVILTKKLDWKAQPIFKMHLPIKLLTKSILLFEISKLIFLCTLLHIGSVIVL
jgi:hypothetical protein